MPYRMLIDQTEWLSNTAVGPLPGTIERVAAYTPLVTTNFDGLLDDRVNNLQALADAVDDLVVDTRQVLEVDKTYYVRTDGSDSNSGSSDSASCAFGTIQHAYDVICSDLDLGGHTVTIKLGDGTYTAGLDIEQPWTGGGSVVLCGDMGSMDAVVISCNYPVNVGVPLPGIFKIKYLKFLNSIYTIFHQSVGTIVIENVNFGAAANYQVSGELSWRSDYFQFKL